MDDLTERLLQAALPHVAFDGWSEATFRAAVADAGVDIALARASCPRGALDLAVAYHKAGDAKMARRMAEEDLSGMRYRDRVAAAIRYRLDAVDKEAVRRGVTLFSLPMNAAEGARLIWGTADAIWIALGDTSDDVNWYTKRATLSAVYSAAVLFWLGDQSPNQSATSDFIDRRIENVMEFEKVKSKFRESALGKAFLSGPGRILDNIRAPVSRRDVPGTSWGR